MEENAISGSHRTDGQRMAGKATLVVLRWILGGLFIYAGITKAMNPDGFMADLGRYQILPEFFLAPVAIYLPFLEILAGLALITGILYLGSLLLTKGMLVVFSIGLASAWWRGLEITCRCFGKGWGDMPVQWALFRNILLLVACMALILFSLRGREFAGRRTSDSDA